MEAATCQLTLPAVYVAKQSTRRRSAAEVLVAVTPTLRAYVAKRALCGVGCVIDLSSQSVFVVSNGTLHVSGALLTAA